MTAATRVSLLLTLVFLCGACRSNDSLRPVDIQPLAPQPLPKTFDYSQQQLRELDEHTRREVLKNYYGDDLRARRVPPPPPVQLPPEIIVREPETTYRDRSYDRSVHCYPYEGRRRTYRRHRHGIGNTLFYGTLGGVIGHQSGHRDEGILIGVGYGLLRDLLHW